MAVDEVLITVAPGETRAAFLAGGVLQRLVLDRPPGGPRIGDLFLGRVSRSVVALEAAFIDIGLAEAGFLGLAEARPPGFRGGTIKQFVNEGERVLVQVIRTPEHGKGAKLTLRPAIAGSHLVFFPHRSGVMLCGDGAPVAEWTRKFERNLPHEADGGWTILPAAAAASENTIASEARQLCASWQDALARSRTTVPPALLAAGPDPVVVALSQELLPALRRIVVDDARMAATLRLAFPDVVEKIERELSGRSLFDGHGVEEQIETLLSPALALKCGGMVSIAETAAVVAIDVDVGAADEGGREATALAVNREAADAIVRQVCLRDLAGHVVIDFVPMTRRGNRHKLLNWLSRAFARRSCPVDLAGFTRLGLVELTRRRRGPSLPEMMLAFCPACEGRGQVMSPMTVALKALRDVIAEDRASPGRSWMVVASTPVISALGGSAMDARKETEARLGQRLKLSASDRCGPENYIIGAATDRERER